MGVHVTTRGFRATFRTWTGAVTFHEVELAEKALGHLVGDETERAYNRGHLLEKRRRLMADWADYLAGALTPEKNPFVVQGGAVPQQVVDEMRTRWAQGRGRLESSPQDSNSTGHGAGQHCEPRDPVPSLTALRGELPIVLWKCTRCCVSGRAKPLARLGVGAGPWAWRPL